VIGSVIDGGENETRRSVESRLASARSWLILDNPFLGALVLRLPMIEADPRWCRTTATDARAIYYNRAYIESLSLDQAKFVLAHEALHCALEHFNRRQHRDKQRWDVACDFAVNALLIGDGLTPPPDAPAADAYAHMSAEEIYPYIPSNTDQRPMDQHLYDSEPPLGGAGRGSSASGGGQGSGEASSPSDDGPGPSTPNGGSDPTPPRPDKRPTGHGAGGPQLPAQRPPPLTTAERDALGQQWRQRLAGAAQHAQQTGRLGSSMARLVDTLLQPQLPWRTLLARYMTSTNRTDYSFARPSRREGPAILPSLRRATVDVVIVLDTSGSINDEEWKAFVTEVNAIKGQINARVTLHACDDHLSAEGPWIFESWENVVLPESFEGHGGTRFTPAFEWAEKLEPQPDVVVYFTDAQGEFPGREPPFPVLWLVKGRKDVPWGQRIQLN
jgi:predicted metal-dependent peptidase